MIELLSRLLIPQRHNTSDPAVRRAYGTLCSGVGIVLNLMLFALKYLAGSLSGSIAITADAFNNLSDAGSSVITLAGFHLAAKRPDPDHPFGHGRVEYLTGLAVAAAIVFMGVELVGTSLNKIFHPQAVSFGWLPAGILLLSVLVKLYMAVYHRAIAKRIASAAMAATATDALSDAVSTTVVLLSMLAGHYWGWNIDAYAGLLVAGFIVLAGIKAARDTVSPLLGSAPDPDLVRQIGDLALSYPEVEGIHDLIVHDYGPGRCIISLHAEVDGKGNMFQLHDAIDNLEQELKERLGCMATVHMDPIDSDNEELERLRTAVSQALREMDPKLSIHDFRMVPGTTHTNLIFDAVVPYTLGMDDAQITRCIRERVAACCPGCRAVVNIDRSYC